MFAGGRGVANPKLFIYSLDNPDRDNVLAFLCKHVEERGGDTEILVSDPKKTRPQEEHYHKLIGDIAEQVKGYGKMRSDEWWKRALINAFRHDTKDDPELAKLWEEFGSVEMVPALNNDGFFVVGEQSRKFKKKLASAFIEWLYAYGAEEGVVWSIPKRY